MENKLKLIVAPNFKNFGERVNKKINLIRNTKENYIVNLDLVRFANGEGKAVLNESVRDKDVYILTDVGNYGQTYKLRGKTQRMTPDEHFQDIKRIISSMGGHAARVSVIAPYLYQSRQDKRANGESLDCSMALRELENYNISELTTIDAHNPAVGNATPAMMTFSNGYVTGDMLISLLKNEDINLDELFICAPDEGAISRTKFLADILGNTKYGHFSKRRDYNSLENGKHPIARHEFIGPKRLDGYDVILVDDMIASGGSLIDSAKQLKNLGANHIYLMATFALFTEGTKKFEQAYNEKSFDRLYSTNLSYVPQSIIRKPWFKSVDCSDRIAHIIDNMNKGESIHNLLKGTEETAAKVKQLKK